jgi:hypothetical protein
MLLRRATFRQKIGQFRVHLPTHPYVAAWLRLLAGPLFRWVWWNALPMVVVRFVAVGW